MENKIIVTVFGVIIAAICIFGGSQLSKLSEETRSRVMEYMCYEVGILILLSIALMWIAI